MSEDKPSPDASRPGESQPPPEKADGAGSHFGDGQANEPLDTNTPETVYAPMVGAHGGENSPGPTIKGRDAADSAVDLSDKRLGEFRLLRRLGRGGMAEVYLAEQTSLKRQVAIKILRSDLLTDEQYVQRFEREATAAAGLNDPTIVQVFMIGEEDGIHFIAQEYVRGQNLYEFLKRKGPPDATVAVHIIRQVAIALQKAAAAGIVHRDIKPENIMLTRKGLVKVTDFGLARLTQGSERLNLTQEGVTMGTPLYMSPEQIQGGNVDHRSDLYSLGVTCYHLLSGYPPFRGETALNVALQHMNKQPPSLSNLRRDLPAELCRIIHRMMEKEPKARYQHADEILQDLKNLSKQIKTSAGKTAAIPASLFETTSGAGGTEGPSETRSSRLRGWLAMAGLFVAVGGLAGILGWLLQPANPLNVSRDEIDQPAEVRRFDNAAQQYSHALLLADNLRAWRAVPLYFPDDTLYRYPAEEQMALLYLRNRQFAEAAEIFNAFVAQGESRPDLAAKGYAGLAVLSSLQGNVSESRRIIASKLTPLPERLTGELSRLLGQAIELNQATARKEAEQDFQNLTNDSGTGKS